MLNLIYHIKAVKTMHAERLQVQRCFTSPIIQETCILLMVSDLKKDDKEADQGEESQLLPHPAGRRHLLVLV
jgi:hypothetical protein